MKVFLKYNLKLTIFLSIEQLLEELVVLDKINYI